MADVFISRNKIELFNQCGLKFDLKYIRKEDGLVDTDDNQSTLFGSLVHNVLEEYFKDEKNNNLLDIYKEQFQKSEVKDQVLFSKGLAMLTDYVSPLKGRKILGLELPFEMYLDNGVPVRGIIDRIDEVSEDEVEIMDYKTGFYALTEEELRSDIQLGIYELVVRNLYPKYKKVKLTLNYLNYGMVSIYKTKEEIAALSDYLIISYNRIQEAIEKKEELLPRINKFCGFCEYKNKCSEFKALIKSADLEDVEEETALMVAPSTGMVIDHDKLDKFHASLKAKLKILKNIETQVANYIKEYIKSSDSKAPVKIGGTKYSLVQRTITTYDANKVADAFIKEGYDLNRVLDVKKTEVDNILIQHNPELLEEIKASASKRPASPYVK